MTPDEIRALPTNQLPRALYDADLAPDHARPDIHQTLIYLCDQSDWPYEHWHPHIRWDHCMPLVERYRIGLVPDLGSPWLLAPHGYEALWTLVDTLADAPAAICRLALLIHYTTRTQEDAGG